MDFQDTRQCRHMWHRYSLQFPVGMYIGIRQQCSDKLPNRHMATRGIHRCQHTHLLRQVQDQLDKRNRNRP